MVDEPAREQERQTRMDTEEVTINAPATKDAERRELSSTVQDNESRVATVQPGDRGQIADYTHSRVDFVDKDGNLLSYVSFSKQSVEEEAKRYAGGGYSLMDERGRHWLWDDCYSALVGIESRTLIVVKPSEPSKRLRVNGGEELTCIGDEQILSYKP